MPYFGGYLDERTGEIVIAVTSLDGFENAESEFSKAFGVPIRLEIQEPAKLLHQDDS